MLNLTTMQSFVSRNVVFYEEIFPLNKNTNKPYMKPLPTKLPVMDEVYYEDEITNKNLEEHALNHNVAEEQNVDQDEDENSPEEIEDTETEQPVLRRSSRDSRQPAWMGDFVTPYSHKAMSATAVTSQQVSPDFKCFLAAIIPQTDPLYFHQAMKYPHWIRAVNDELDALERN